MSSETDDCRWLLTPDHEQYTSVEHLRKRLQFFVGNPLRKWQIGRRVPIKIIIEIIKVIFVTVQLCSFASQRFIYVDFISQTRVVFEHLLIEKWDVSREINAYPPSGGVLAVYSRAEYFSSIDFAVNSFRNMSRDSLANFSTRSDDIVYCFQSQPSSANNTNQPPHCARIDTSQLDISRQWHLSLWLNHYHHVYFNVQSMMHSFVSFIVLQRAQIAGTFDNIVQCFRHNVTLHFTDIRHSGQARLQMSLLSAHSSCSNNSVFSPSDQLMVTHIPDILLLLLCIISFFICSRSVYRTTRLYWLTRRTLRATFQHTLTPAEVRYFIQFGYMFICVNDILLVVGVLYKLHVEYLPIVSCYKNYVPVLATAGDYDMFAAQDTWLAAHTTIASAWDVCSLTLGVGTLLAWISLLRFLSRFPSYNLLLLTVSHAAPKALRFTLCASACFAGFSLCGWMVLSPYHIKFRTFGSTCEALFSLMNGDDMFATYAQLSEHVSASVYIFCRVYLYVFVAFFIYLVLSLVISIVVDAFECVKLYYSEGFPQTSLDQFIYARAYCADEFSDSSDQWLLGARRQCRRFGVYIVGRWNTLTSSYYMGI